MYVYIRWYYEESRRNSIKNNRRRSFVRILFENDKKTVH